MKVSWVVLTYNRAATVARSMEHNLRVAGRAADELIWVDNGSTDGVRDVMRALSPDVSVLNRENLGVAKGYNRGQVLATGSHIVITGCDRLMPEGWLDTLTTCFEKIPQTGIVSVYSRPIDQVPERHRAPERQPEVISGIEILRAMPFEARIVRRDVLQRAGHLREDFGLYGWEDCEWAARAERACRELALLTYILPGMLAEHLGTEGVQMADGRDEDDYHRFKQREAADPAKTAKLRECEAAGFPYYSPYV